MKLSMLNGSVVGISPNDSETMTFKALALEFHESWSKRVSRAHAKRVMSQLESTFPFIGELAIKDLTAYSVLKALRPIEAKGYADCAHRTNTVVGQVLKFGVATGRMSHDVRAVLSTVLQKNEPTHFPSLPIEELPELITVINSPNKSVHPSIRIALKLLMLTMVRSNELLGAQWSELDFEQRLWVIPSSRMKMRREHVVPLSSEALFLFQEARLYAKQSTYVFPSVYKPAQPRQPREANRALVSLGFEGRLCAHGIRSLMATLLISRGYSIDLIDSALAHEQSKVRRAYFRQPDIKARRAMLDDLGQYLASLGLL
jgi:integrase